VEPHVTGEERPNSSDTALRMRFGAIAVAVCLVLFGVYWFYFRPSYSTILTNIEPDVAAAVVRTLDERKIPYRLVDAGRTVQVIEQEADKARVELVGSELPMRGQVGFEIFNQSDMGLTEFEQKINYLRALQGELARTILMLDGISQARVHLGLAEKSIFAAERQRPKASITLVLKPGSYLTEARVSGIQRLVAGAVPEMVSDDVSVLDASGRVVSSQAPVGMSASKDPVAEGYRTKGEAILAELHPSLECDLEVSLIYRPAPYVGAPNGSISGVPEAGDSARTSGVGQRMSVNLRVLTRNTPDISTTEALRTDLINGLSLDPAKGDTVVVVRQTVQNGISSGAIVTEDRVVSQSPLPVPAPTKGQWKSYWPWVILGAVAVLLAASLNDRRRAKSRQKRELGSFAQELDRRLNAHTETGV